MEAFVWNDRFLTGIESVDTQHRHLFDVANQVGEMLIEARPADPAAIEAVFHELAAYANQHFKDEETLMQAAGMDELHFRHHVGSHREFVEQVKTMWAQRASMTAPAEILHGFLVAWLSYHILGEDQAMARNLARLRGETPPPVDSERTTSALLEAMRNLYRVLSRMNGDLAESNRRLEEKVAQRTSELTTTNGKLQQEQAALKAMLQKVQETQSQLLQSEKMASIGQLAAGVAHEINNPIGFVNSNLGSLGRYIDSLMRLAVLGASTAEGQAIKEEVNLDFLRTDVVDLLRESQEGLDRVRKIVANLKDFSHVDQAEWQQADIVAGLESTLNVASHELKYKADIVRELAPLPSVRCIPAQINQVFLNLLVNSAQAMRDRGAIILRSGVEGEFAWIEVEDSGCGMDETTKRRMFEPFFTTKPVGTGTGLGMSLTYDIIKKHGGELEVDSTPGVGTRIRVRLPINGPAES